MNLIAKSETSFKYPIRYRQNWHDYLFMSQFRLMPNRRIIFNTIKNSLALVLVREGEIYLGKGGANSAFRYVSPILLGTPEGGQRPICVHVRVGAGNGGEGAGAQLSFDEGGRPDDDGAPHGGEQHAWARHDRHDRALHDEGTGMKLIISLELTLSTQECGRRSARERWRRIGIRMLFLLATRGQVNLYSTRLNINMRGVSSNNSIRPVCQHG